MATGKFHFVDISVFVYLTVSHSESALTTDAPTPWRPPDTLYPPPPNFPPAWRTVIPPQERTAPSAPEHRQEYRARYLLRYDVPLFMVTVISYSNRQGPRLWSYPQFHIQGGEDLKRRWSRYTFPAFFLPPRAPQEPVFGRRRIPVLFSRVISDITLKPP